MIADEEGFLRPLVEEDACSGCALCEKTCPPLTGRASDKRANPNVFAGWHKDPEIRAKSSSGGAFSALAQSILADGGVVVGAAFSEKNEVAHICIEHPGDLDRLRRSKYVQSRIDGTFQATRTFLEQGRRVLFVGTPCQIAGLTSYLDDDPDTLFTVDFICHGVPSPELFRCYLEWLENRFGQSLDAFNFRDKRQGWQNVMASVRVGDGKQSLLKGPLNSYYHGFVAGVSLRPSCYECRHMNYPRPSDLTLGDFWGIGEVEPFPFPEQTTRGISLLLANSEKGDSLLHKAAPKLVLVERTREEAQRRNIHLQRPAKRPAARDTFYGKVAQSGFAGVETVLRLPLKRRAVQWVKENIHPDVVKRLRRMAR